MPDPSTAERALLDDLLSGDRERAADSLARALAEARSDERAATIEKLASGVGHDLRNPLGVIATSAFLLRQHLGAQATIDARLDRHLSRIADEVRRADRLLGDLASLRRDRPLRRRPTAIGPLLRDSVTASSLPADIEVTVSAPAELGVALDADQMGRALAALILNASQAMDGRGRIWLDAARVGGELHVSVRDAGPGVPAGDRARIFEALFSTKPKASGLGLALARRVAEAHGGTIALLPSEAGAIFLLRVPGDA
jgi:signal transduction histidine kinase